MLLPPEILDTLCYYHHDVNEKDGMTDIVTVTTQGWLFKHSKKFEFRRSKSWPNEGYVTYTMVDECSELLDQLKKRMRDKVNY